MSDTSARTGGVHPLASPQPLAAPAGGGDGGDDAAADLRRRPGHQHRLRRWPCPTGRPPSATTCSSIRGRKMVGGIFYEHSHRLIGSAVGLLTVALAVSLWLTEPRQWLRVLGLAAVVAVIVQGVLGGLRVVLLNQPLAIFHACLAQAFFALLVSSCRGDLAVLGARCGATTAARCDAAPLDCADRRVSGLPADRMGCTADAHGNAARRTPPLRRRW